MSRVRQAVLALRIVGPLLSLTSAARVATAAPPSQTADPIDDPHAVPCDGTAVWVANVDASLTGFSSLIRGE